MKKTYKHYSVLMDKDIEMIRSSLIQEHKTPNYVSRNWLIERLSQCLCWIEGCNLLYAAAVLVSTQTYWAIWGPVETSTATPSVIGISSGVVSNVILKSPNTPDCYQLTVTPNGTIGTKWAQCPK